MGDFSEVNILNKSDNNHGVSITVDTNEISMVNSSLGIKADLLFQDKLNDIIVSDIVNSTLNKLACYGSEILSFSYNISAKNPNSEQIEMISNEIKNELSKYGCNKVVKNIVETGYNIDKFDINSTAVGKIIKEKADIVSGDIIIGLTTDKMHLGLYTHLLDKYREGLISIDDFKNCLKPSLNYYNEIISLYKKNKIKSCVYIDAKDIHEQLKDFLPKELKCDINIRHIPHQPVIDKLCQAENINYYEKYSSGICCCLITDKASNEIFFEDCKKFNPFVLGTID